MEFSSKDVVRGVVATVGGAIAGPAGAILGSFAGGLLGGALPFVTLVMEKLVTDLTDKSIHSVSDKIVGHFTPPDRSPDT